MGKLFSLVLMVCVFALTFVCLIDNASAQQCNVQSNSSVQASQAAALQNQALQSVLQAQQLSQQVGTTSAVAVTGGGRVNARQFAIAPSQRVVVQAPLALQLAAPVVSAPAVSSSSASAVATVPAPATRLTLGSVAAVQPQLLACRPKLLGNRARTSTSRSVAVTRTRG